MMAEMSSLLFWRSCLLGVAICVLCECGGCQTAAPPPSAPNAYIAAEVRRRLSEDGLLRNDQLTVTTPDEIGTLRSFFPDMGTKHVSTIKEPWTPWIIIFFRRADGTGTYAVSDYRLYRIDEGQSGEFVVSPGFGAHIEQLFSTLPPQ